MKTSTINRVSFLMAQFALADQTVIPSAIPKRCSGLSDYRNGGARTGGLILKVNKPASLHVFCEELQTIAGFVLVGANVQTRTRLHTINTYPVVCFTFVPAECVDKRRDAFLEIEQTAQSVLDDLTSRFFWRDVRFHENPRTRGEFDNRNVFWTVNADAACPVAGLPDSFISLGSRPVVCEASEYKRRIGA
jgi:hypothetical protein